MSPQGTTTVVKINRPNLDRIDQKVLCSAICKCKDTPGIGKDGRSLKQSCVSTRLKGLDQALKHHSIYKPEINYDMTQQPPAPIMDSTLETKGHDWLPGWIQKWWDIPDRQSGPRPPFKAREGMVRRPDVVIVNDPAKPPTQDNIKQVVEIKFPPDTATGDQLTDYARIAGGDSKLVVVGPSDCDCGQPDPDHPKIPVEQLGPAAAAAALLYMLLAKRPLPLPAY
ncbi:VRR-NUC domain protein [Janthinobacterium agaricidamnosum NBRC 102515 = DSM 9628]|uniref:VRR-NUC domain protein n=2 Tax=Janthinobacterium agaricidamnosum TaxID=55508 RepID=W0UYJ3_9BURK|nr:VRR-NUC domain protein [Janthinobacterium agaricidamnosum NBRC 102515 = DSM 9628]